MASDRRMFSSLEPELLRGIPLHVALAGFGTNLRAPDSGMFRIDPMNYELSRRIQAFDAFISHDWRATHSGKFLCLTIIFNSPAAAVASSLVSLLLGILVLCEVIDDDLALLLTPICLATFYIVLFSWHWLRCLFRRPVMIFLDKFCIAQHSEELKMKGILGLGAFLLQSKNLLVLWSPQYFSRLWCTYELVTFLKDKPRQDAVTFMPVKMSYLLFLFSAFWHAVVFSYYLLQEVLDIVIGTDETDDLFLSYLLFLVGCLACLVIPFVNYLGIELMSDLEILPKQLETFRIQDASCFCCSNGHTHPVTGRSIPCDRQLVHETLCNWTNGRPGMQKDTEATLEFFNDLVQQRLSRVVLQSLRGTFPAMHVLCMTCVCNVPFISVYVAAGILKLLEGGEGEEGEDGEDGEDVGAGVILRSFCQATYPVLVILFAARVFQPLLKLGLFLQKLVPRAVASCLLVPVMLAFSILTWFPFEYTLQLTEDEEDRLLPLIPYAALLLATAFAYAHCLRANTRPTVEVGCQARSEAREKDEAAESEDSTVSL